jgi:hypothetical protein
VVRGALGRTEGGGETLASFPTGGGAALIDVGGEREGGGETLASFPTEVGAALINRCVR